MTEKFSELLRHGLSVIPVCAPTARSDKPGKKPLFPWTEFQHAHADETTVAKWALTYPDCNVAVVTGKVSGVVVVDCDSPLAEQGFRSLGDVPETWMVRTGKGSHFYFQWPGFKLSNATNKFKEQFPNIDIRGDGGIVVAPPSVHPNGTAYEWINHPDEYLLKPLPPWLLDLLTDADEDRRLRAYCLSALESEIKKILSALRPDPVTGAGGARNGTLNTASFNLGTLLSHGYIDEQTVRDRLYEAAINAGLEEKEALQTIDSGILAGQKRPRQLPEPPTPSPRAPVPQPVRTGARQSVAQRVDPVSFDRPHANGNGIDKSNVASVDEEGRITGGILSAPSHRNGIADTDWPAPPAPPPLPPMTRRTPDGIPFTNDDVGNAARLIALHGDKLLFCPQTDTGWHRWDAVRWRPCELGEHLRLAIDTTDWMATLSDETPFQRFVTSSRKHNNLSACLKVAQTDPAISVSSSDLDADPYLINCYSGTIDLLELGRLESLPDGRLPASILRPHDPGDRMTMTTRATFDADADYDAWLTFLLKIHNNDADVVEFIQRMVGYMLSGLTSEQKAFFLIGHGKNGKTVFREALRYLWSDYGVETPFDTFIPRRNPGAPRPDLADLQGKRLIVTSEGPENTRLDEAMIKELTGGEHLKTRKLNENLRTFPILGKILAITNHKPAISGNDEGIWRRILLIPHLIQISDAETDPHLQRRLQGHVNGILRWALEGYWKWSRPGDQGGLRPPSSIVDATSEYRVEQDRFGQFLEECCVLDPTAKVAKGDLYKRYTEWAEAQGEYKKAAISVGKMMMERAHRIGVTSHHGGAAGRQWIGVRLRFEQEPTG